MSLVRKIAGRSLRQRPARTFFSVLGVALGIAVSVGVFTLDHNTVLGLSLPGLNDWKPELEVRPAQGIGDPHESLTATPGVAGVSAFFQNDVVIRRARSSSATSGDPTTIQAISGRLAERAANPDEPMRVRLFALESGALPQLDALRVESGATLSADAHEREVLVGEALASSLALQPGDVVTLARPSRAARQACIDGEIRTLDPEESSRAEVPVEESFHVAGILSREKLGRRSQGMVAVVDYRWGRELYRGARVEPVYWVKQDPKVDIERLRTSLASSFSYELNKSVLVGAAADERAFRNGVRMAGLLALVLGLYVIFHTLSMSLVERVREVATLHALGATRAQVTKIFLCEALAISFLAAVLGIGGGLGLARALLLLGITTLGSGHHITVFDVPWGAVLSLAALGVGVALLGSIYPLLRARNASPAAALRGDDVLHSRSVARGFHAFAALLLAILLPALYLVIVPVVGETQGVLVGAILGAVGILAVLVVLPLIVPSLLILLSNALVQPLERVWTLSGRLAARSIRESRSRVAVSAAALALVSASFVSLKGMTASLRAEIEVWARDALVSKVYLGSLPNVAFDKLSAELAKYPGVRAIENGSARTYVPFLVLGMRTSELAKHGPCRDDPAILHALERDDSMILSKQLARHLGYKIGDRVHVANSSGAVQDLTVVAISDDYGYFPHPDERLYGVVSDRYMKRAFCMDVDTLTECSVVLDPGTDPDVVKTAVRSAWPEIKSMRYERGSELLRVHLEDIDHDFLLFDIILGLTALLAGLGVLNGLLLSALERTKELGVLKALGTSRRQITGMVLCESAVVGLLGGLLGTALGAALIPLVVRALEGLSGLDLPQVGAGKWLWICPLGALVLVLVAALYPIRRMNRMNAVSAVRTG
jgi:putative ABC transport system permease protein